LLIYMARHLQGTVLKVLPMSDFPSGRFHYNKFWKVSASRRTSTRARGDDLTMCACVQVEEDGRFVKIRPDPYIVHNNWVVGHSEKRERIQKVRIVSDALADLAAVCALTRL
jgi:hypothetical protein